MSAQWPRLREAPSWRGRSADERARALELACRSALQILQGVPDADARLRRTDPVPRSTQVLLRRLAAARNG